MWILNTGQTTIHLLDRLLPTRCALRVMKRATMPRNARQKTRCRATFARELVMWKLSVDKRRQKRPVERRHSFMASHLWQSCSQTTLPLHPSIFLPLTTSLAKPCLVNLSKLHRQHRHTLPFPSSLKKKTYKAKSWQSISWTQGQQNFWETEEQLITLCTNSGTIQKSFHCQESSKSNKYIHSEGDTLGNSHSTSGFFIRKTTFSAYKSSLHRRSELQHPLSTTTTDNRLHPRQQRSAIEVGDQETSTIGSPATSGPHVGKRQG